MDRILGEWGFIHGSSSHEVVTSTQTGWQLVGLDELEPRWRTPDTAPPAELPDFLPQVVFLANSIVIFDGRSCPANASGWEMVVLDRTDGTRRRSIDCHDLPRREDSAEPVAFAAPGAVVIQDTTELVAIGG